MSGSRRRGFYGWWVVLTAALGLLLGPIPIVVFCFGVFLKPLIQEFHSSRSAVSLAFTLFSLIQAICLPLVGRLVDRIGARKVILPFSCVAGLTLLSTWFYRGRLWQIYLLYSMMGILICGTGPVAYGDVISHWFDRHRGLALGLMMAGLGTGALLMPSVAQYLIARFGWRIAFGAFGAAILVVMVPVVAALLKERPEPMGFLPDGEPYVVPATSRENADPGMTLYQALRSPIYWLMFCTFFLVSASAQGAYTHIAAIFVDRGSVARTAAFATSLFGVGLLAGRAGAGYLLDRYFAPRVAAIIFGFAAAGIGLLGVSGTQELAFIAAVLIGVGVGAEGDVMGYLTSRYFGLRSFGSIYGFTFGGFVLGGGFGVYLMDIAFDATGSYALTLAVFCMLTLVGAALMTRLGPYRYQKRYQKTSVDACGPELKQILELES